MLSVFTYQVLRLLRDRILLAWVVAFPVILSCLFMAMFSSLDESYQATPLSLGVVQDDAYRAATGLDATIRAVSEEGERHLLNPTLYATADQAQEAARKGDTVGYIDVEDGDPVLHVTPEVNTGSKGNTVLVLRAVLDSYTQTRAEYEALAAAGAQAGPPDTGSVPTRRAQVTPSVVEPQTRYYFSLLAFACGMGTAVAMTAVQGVTATSSHLGTRLTLAGLPRWKVLVGTLAAAWVCVLGCLLVAFAFIRLVVGVDFGPHALLCLVAIGVSSLLSCAAGAMLGTSRRMNTGIVSGIASLLSLFTGLYGSGAQKLADAVEYHVPLLAQANPLWQSAHSFYGLLYYDSLAPFARSCAVMVGMTCLFLGLALVRMRRMSHEHL